MKKTDNNKMNNLYVVPEIIVNAWVKDDHKEALKANCHQVCLFDRHKYEPLLTKNDLAVKLGCKVFDTAIPQQYCNDIYECTGQHISPHIVWCYDNSTVGEPFALTNDGKLIISIYERVMGIS